MLAPSSRGTGVPANRCAPHPGGKSGGDTQTRSKPSSSNHSHTCGSRSGAHLPLVHTTVPPAAHNCGQKPIVRFTSASVMLPNRPQATTRCAGTSGAYWLVSAASAVITVTPSRPASAARRRANSAFRGSSSTSRAVTSAPRGWLASTPIRSRPWPAHRLIARSSPGGASSSMARICSWIMPRRRTRGLSGFS
jgi:hypothetical protein